MRNKKTNTSILTIIGLTVICSFVFWHCNPKTETEKAPVRKKLDLIQEMEHLLTDNKYTFQPCDFTSQYSELKQHKVSAYCNEGKKEKVTLYRFKNQKIAIKKMQAITSLLEPQEDFAVNGAFGILVETNNNYKRNHILSVFAGEE